MTDQIEKEITINELATIVINGFENVNKKFGNMDRQFENVDKRFGNMDRQFGNIDKEFKSVHQEIENLAISTANGFMEVHKEINGQNNEIKGIKSDLGDLKEYMNYRFTGVENRIDDMATTRGKHEE